MEILEAYCIELGEVVDIYDAQNAYFDLPEGRRKRFTFRCSDEECRRIKNPLVSGVNYDKLAEETEKYRQQHFRAPPANEHLSTCIWHDSDAETSAINSSIDDEKSRVERAKKTNVIDVFQPGRSDTLKQIGGQAKTADETTGPDKAHADKANDHATNKTSGGYNKTPRLERFIDCWLQFKGDELKTHEVTIEGKTLSYRSAVTNPTWIREEHNSQRILYGAADISLWPAENPTQLYLNFRDDCKQFAGNLGSKSLTIHLPLARIHKHRGANVLLSKLKQAQRSDHYLKVYCWGTIKPRESRPGYIVDIVSLNNLVLKPVEKKSATKEISGAAGLRRQGSSSAFIASSAPVLDHT